MKHNDSRKYTRLLPIILVVIPGMIIGVWSILSVSEQKRAKELKLEETYLSTLHRLRNEMETRFLAALETPLKQAASSPLPVDNPALVQQTFKEILLKNPVATYPFLIDEKREFIFPFSGTWRITVFPSFPVIRDKNVEKRFKLGEELELKERDMNGAMKMYLQCLEYDFNGSDELKPYIYNAIGRCYYKRGKFPQAITYYHMALSLFGDPFSNKSKTDFSLYVPILRQLAHCYRQLAMKPETARIYLLLYESILQYESSTAPEQFTFFKNEALDYLNSNLKEKKAAESGATVNLEDEQLRFRKARALDRIDKESDIDISLRWSFFDENTSTPDKNDALRFQKIREFYLSTDEKTQFYKTIKQFTEWEQPVKCKRIRNASSMRPYEIAWTRIDTRAASTNPLFFGYMISPGFFRTGETQKITSKYFDDPELTVSILDREMTDINSFSPENPGYRLLTVPFQKLPGAKVLILYSANPDFFPRKARQEIYFNYFLIGAFTLLLVLGIVFFYKYQARETELVRLKSEFTDRASHTLKTPLTRIRMLAEKLSLGWVADENKKSEYLQTILSETDRMSEMITNMLDFSKIEAGKKQYVMEYGYLSPVVKEAVESYAPYIRGRGFRFEAEIENNVPPALFDSNAIRLIVTNLLQNAVKYSTDDKYLNIRFYAKEEKAIIDVTDHGIGIAEKEREKIFQQFYRVPGNYIQSVEGSGLGLYLVRHAVHAHSGTITVAGLPGGGSCFTVSIPLTTEQTPVSQEDKTS